tara:strand:- start:395 stop:2896 length:2502 start_codon:yes stop_codon:yes gene_type:complete
MTSEIRANKQTNRAGLGTVTYTDTGIIVSGIVTCTELSGLTALNISGVGTASTLDINGDLDVDGHTELDRLRVSGIATFNNGIDVNVGVSEFGNNVTFGTANGNQIVHQQAASRFAFGDNCAIVMGASSDLKLIHDGSNSYIEEQGTGSLFIKGGTLRIQADDTRLINAAGNSVIQVNGNSAELRFNGNRKLYTSNTGVIVNEDIDVDGHTNLDNVSIAGVTTITANNVIGLNVENSSGGGAQTTIRSKSTVANASNFVRSESSDNKYIGLLKYGTGHSSYGALAAGGGAVYANSSVPITIMSDGSYINFATGGNTERLRITSAGNLRLGLDSVTEQTDSAHYIMTLTGKSGQTGAGAIAFKDPSANTDGFIFADSGNLFITADYSNATADSSIRFRVDGSSEKVRFDSTGKVSIGDAATHTYSAHSEGDDLVIGGAGWRGMTIYGEGGGGVIQFADDADNRVGQILYYHAENSMSFRVNGNQTRLKINSDGDVCIGNSGNPPWTETGGNYNNISLCGNDASSSGFLNLGNGAATNNADFDLSRIKIHNGATEVARITGTTATSDNGDASIKFFTKKAGSGLKEILRIRNDGFVETMYDQNTGSYSLSASPTPRLRIRNNYGGDGIISSAQFFAKRGSGAASIFDIGVVTTSTDYESNLIISSRNTDASYSEKWRIESEGQLRMNYGNNAKQAYALRSTFRTITGHTSTGYQYVRFAFLAARTPYRVCIGTTGGNYGPGAQFFTVLRNWDSTTLYVSDKFNMGSAYANAVRMQSDNSGGDYYLELSINLTTTSQGFNASIIPIGANAGTMRTALQFYGSGMSNLSATSSAHSL